jgi:hypothetical protein
MIPLDDIPSSGETQPPLLRALRLVIRLARKPRHYSITQGSVGAERESMPR